jgi:hypothetical protein
MTRTTTTNKWPRAEARFVRFWSLSGPRETHDALVRTLMRLPSNVRQYVRGKCSFVSTGLTIGLCLSMSDLRRHDYSHRSVRPRV